MPSSKIKALKKSRKFMAALREEQTGAAPDRDMEIKALAAFLAEPGVNCGTYSNPALAKLVMDFLADHKRR
jgi:hypothetical protein